MSDTRKLKLCRIVTVPWTFQTLLWGQMRCIAAHDIDLTLVSSPGPELELVARDVGARAVCIPMERKPAPTADLRSLVRLTRFLRRNRFDIVHSATPKAGFLAAWAGYFARVPTRIHTFTGQPWVELKGLRRSIPRACDALTARMTTHCYADSHSQRAFLIAQGLANPQRIAVVGSGSIGGVDLQRFSLEKWGGARSIQTRRELGIPDDAQVIIFVGRVTKDKGIRELVSAFEELAKIYAQMHLLLVGPLEPERDPLPAETLQLIEKDHRIHRIGFHLEPEKYLAAADVFCLPSYREGFGSVAIEAAAMKLPTVVTQVTGLVDAVIDGVTGLLVPPKEVGPLAAALRRLIESPEMGQAFGQAGYRRVMRDFDAVSVNTAVVDEYFRLKVAHEVTMRS